MECKWWLVVFAVLLIIHAEQTEAARRKKKPKKEEMKCLPGRTVLKFSSKLKSSLADIIHTQGLGGKSDCQFCVCSVDGWDEFCFNRPARNVNECMKVKEAEEYAQSHGPFDHTRSIFHRIRRDWYEDLSPRCERGISYYTSEYNGTQTDIEDSAGCYFCVCHTNGREVGCIRRHIWHCDYQRKLSDPNHIRYMYARLFKQDRPSYFRSASYRMRRTMESSVFDLMETGGDALCCGHVSGHVKNLHRAVRNRVRNLRKRLPKEDLIHGDSRADYADFIVNND